MKCLPPSRNTFKTKLHLSLEIPLIKSNLDQNSISSLGPSILNVLSNDLKSFNTVASFTHNYKKLEFSKSW